MPEFKAGDYAVPDRKWLTDSQAEKLTGVWQVVRPNARTITCKPLAGGRPVRFERGMLMAATPEQVEAARKSAPPFDPRPGMAVTYRNRRAPKGLYVMIKVHPNGLFDLARLGGEPGHFLNVHHRYVDLVDVSALEADLLGLAAGKR